MANTLFANQSELATSHEKLDDQFAVMVRLMLTKVNEIAARFNDLLAESSVGNLSHLKVDALTFDFINETFLMLAELKRRPDYRDHLRPFYLGELADIEAVRNLPEPSVVETEVPEEIQARDGGQNKEPQAEDTKDKPTLHVVGSEDDSGEEYPEGAQIFGGDDHEHHDEAEGPAPQDEQGDGEAHEVPEVRDQDSDSDGAGNGEEGGDVPEVRDGV